MDNAITKIERHNLIREILNKSSQETQADLVDALRARGINCTQATVSRDIKELKLTKIQSADGKYYYAEPGGGDQSVVNKLLDAFSSGYLGSDFSGNIVVIKTVIGMAPACALAVDAVRWLEVVGTLAGDDTILIVTKSASASKKLIKRIETLLT